MILNLPGLRLSIWLLTFSCIGQYLHYVVCLTCNLFLHLQTNVREIDTYPNMEYTDSRNRVFAYKSDIVDSIVRACARK